MRHQVGIKYRPIVKEDKTKVEGGAKHKLRCFQQSTLIWEANFNETTSRLEDKAFEFRKKHAAELMKSCGAIYKFIAINYKHRGP